MEMENTLGLLTLIGQAGLILLTIAVILVGVYYAIIVFFAKDPNKYVGEKGIALTSAYMNSPIKFKVIDAIFIGQAMEDIKEGDYITFYEISNDDLLIKKYDPVDEYTV